MRVLRTWAAVALLLFVVTLLGGPSSDRNAPSVDRRSIDLSAPADDAFMATAPASRPFSPVLPALVLLLIASAAAMTAWRALEPPEGRGAAPAARLRKWRARLVGAPPSARFA